MASSSLKSVNPNAEIMSKEAALFMNINAAKGLQGVMKSNLGPKAPSRCSSAAPEVRAALVSPETPDAFAASSSVPGLARLTARVGPLARRDQASAGPRAV